MNNQIFKPRTDFGPTPFVTDLGKATITNNTYRTALWTGPKMQITMMSIDPSDDIGLEVHPDNDQLLRIEHGTGIVEMGPSEHNITDKQRIHQGYTVFVPAGTWHNIINTGTDAMKISVVYSPSHHPHGTVHQTKAIAEASESHHY